jgi:hypothetical protein
MPKKQTYIRKPLKELVDFEELKLIVGGFKGDSMLEQARKDRIEAKHGFSEFLKKKEENININE